MMWIPIYCLIRIMKTVLLPLFAGLSLVACGGGSSSGPATPAPTVQLLATVAQSSMARNTDPQTTDADVQAVVNGNTDFAGRALSLMDVSGDANANSVFSPYSLTLGLALPAAGARGGTLAGMEKALSFLPQERLKPALNKLDRHLVISAAPTQGQGASLNIVNTVWSQTGQTLAPAYLDTLAEHYGAGLRLLDFQSQSEPARQAINAFISEQTRGRIKDLLPPGAVTSDTRVLLTNAIWFKGDWLHRFDAARTTTRAFTSRANAQSQVPFMQQEATLRYVRMNDHEAVELPYKNTALAMTLVLPAQGAFDAVVRDFGSARMTALASNMQPRYLSLTMPKFTFSSALDASALLRRLGMDEAFDPSLADFSGITGQRGLVLSSVQHNAFIAVDEQGTEAAAATGSIIGVVSVPPEPEVRLVLDRPFLFVIRDTTTGTILFMGKVVTL